MKRPQSMTAFGRGEAGAEPGWIVELRSVNHRYLDVKVKMPREYAILEDRVKKEIGAAFNRGHIEVLISQGGTRSGTRQARVNLELAAQYLRCLDELQGTFALEGRPTLAMLANLPDVISEEDREDDLEALWLEMRMALRAACDSCRRMRGDEGQILKTDLLRRLQGFAATVDSIADLIPGLVDKRQATLRERLHLLLQGIELDPIRLAQEVAIMADRYDVSEELVRLRSHIQQFLAFMELNEPIGRRLDFLLQEFLREINTLASKINDTEITHKTVSLKNEVEQIREQVQNLE